VHIVVFHYHLLPGGVTGVITEMRRSLLAYAPSVDHVTLVCGSEENVRPTPGTIEVVPEIGYHSRQQLALYDPEPAPASVGPVGRVEADQVARGARELSNRIVEILLERYGGEDTVWWIHNPHLGKNPAFTHAIYRIAGEHPEQRIVLHIHDFPESGRYSNLRALHIAGVEELYPQHAHVAYAVINSRDERYLENAGVRSVSYLPNPVTISADQRADIDRARVRGQLASQFGTEFPFFDPDAPLLLYPVRTIRRKNILEAALLAVLMSDPVNLVVTLPGVSRAEKPYSDLVEHAYREGLIRGLWGIGSSLQDASVSFEALQSSADAIMSSSVQEGFGFQYIAPLLLGVPLVARRLDIMDDIDELYSRSPHHFYDQVWVPAVTPSLSGPQSLLRFRYSERIDRLRAHLPETDTAKLTEEVERLIGGDALEFSFLPPQMQLAVLSDAVHHQAYRDEIRELNARLVERCEATISSTASPLHQTVEDAFGLRRFADRAERILAALGSDEEESTRKPGPGEVERSLIRVFAHVAYERLLFA
jgi:hypothetical protein